MEKAILCGVTHATTVVQGVRDGTTDGLGDIAVGFLEEVTSKLRPKLRYQLGER